MPSTDPMGAWSVKVDERVDFANDFSYSDLPKVIRRAGRTLDGEIAPETVDQPGSFTGLLNWPLSHFRWGHWREVHPAIYINRPNDPTATSAPPVGVNSSPVSFSNGIDGRIAGADIASPPSGWMMLRNEDTVDPRVARRDDVDAVLGMAIPGGFPALIVRGSETEQQDPIAFPTGNMLIAAWRNQPKAAKFSSLVFDVRGGNISEEFHAPLHSIMKPMALEYGYAPPDTILPGQKPPTFDVVRSLALNFAAHPDDGTGHGLVTSIPDLGDGNVYYSLANEGNEVPAYLSWTRGGPLHPGSRHDRHEFTERSLDAGGAAARPLHLWIDALWYKSEQKDGTLDYTDALKPRVTSGTVPLDVHFGWDPYHDRFGWWVNQFVLPPTTPHGPPTTTTPPPTTTTPPPTIVVPPPIHVPPTTTTGSNDPKVQVAQNKPGGGLKQNNPPKPGNNGQQANGGGQKKHAGGKDEGAADGKKAKKHGGEPVFGFVGKGKGGKDGFDWLGAPEWVDGKTKTNRGNGYGWKAGKPKGALPRDNDVDGPERGEIDKLRAQKKKLDDLLALIMLAGPKEGGPSEEEKKLRQQQHDLADQIDQKKREWIARTSGGNAIAAGANATIPRVLSPSAPEHDRQPRAPENQYNPGCVPFAMCAPAIFGRATPLQHGGASHLGLFDADTSVLNNLADAPPYVARFNYVGAQTGSGGGKWSYNTKAGEFFGNPTADGFAWLTSPETGNDDAAYTGLAGSGDSRSRSRTGLAIDSSLSGNFFGFGTPATDGSADLWDGWKITTSGSVGSKSLQINAVDDSGADAPTNVLQLNAALSLGAETDIAIVSNTLTLTGATRYRITGTGTINDIVGGVDGQVVIFRPNTAVAATFAHNAGSAGTKIYNNTGANKTINQIFQPAGYVYNGTLGAFIPWTCC